MCSNQREINSCHPAGSPLRNASNNNNINNRDRSTLLGSQEHALRQRRRPHPFGVNNGTFPMGLNQSSSDHHHQHRATRVLEIIDSALSILSKDDDDDEDDVVARMSSNSRTTTM
jgi:hypothetical protein